jgi:hypothetical protein
MDPISSASQPADLTRQLLQPMMDQEMALQKKLMQFNAETKVQQATDATRGAAMDIVA